MLRVQDRKTGCAEYFSWKDYEPIALKLEDE